jgi:hypothetical protein
VDEDGCRARRGSVSPYFVNEVVLCKADLQTCLLEDFLPLCRCLR